MAVNVYGLSCQISRGRPFLFFLPTAGTVVVWGLFMDFTQFGRREIFHTTEVEVANVNCNSDPFQSLFAHGSSLPCFLWFVLLVFFATFNRNSWHTSASVHSLVMCHKRENLKFAANTVWLRFKGEIKSIKFNNWNIRSIAEIKRFQVFFSVSPHSYTLLDCKKIYLYRYIWGSVRSGSGLSQEWRKKS